ncbi:MAG: LysR substrate-binding domain-containing protein [Betaproteobacteria bacterium]
MKENPTAINHLNLRLLQTFMLLAEHRSFKVAAEHARRSPSAISTQIKQLEAQLGISLFHRTTRQVRMTREAEQLFVGARRAMQEIVLSLRNVQETVDMRRGKVALACVPTIASTRLPSILSVFEKDYPEVHVNLRELQVGLNQAVRDGEVDFGVGPVVSTDSDLDFDAILDESLMALVPRTFLRGARARKTISLQALTSMPMLVLNTNTAMREYVEATIKAHSLTFKAKYQCIQAQTQIAMAEAGLGAVILPESLVMAHRSLATHALRIVEPQMSRKIAIVTLRSRSLSPAAARLAQLIRELIQVQLGKNARRRSS